MAMTNNPVFAQTPIVGIATLTTPTAITSRAIITGTTGLTQLTATSTNGTRIDKITIRSKATSVAGMVDVWIYNGTTSYLFDEILISAVTASTTVAAYSIEKDYQALVLPPTYQLFISVQVQQDLTAFAFGGQY